VEVVVRTGKILRHSVSIDEEQVFSLIHKPVALAELQPSRFAGRVALWAEDAERRYGDSINPVMTYVENGPHRVAWIRHEGEDVRTGERFCVYHIVCDCIAGVEGNSPRESVAQILGCRAVLRALQRRAAFVDHTYRTCEILSALRDPETGDFEQPNAFHQFAVKTIAGLLELDARHPEEWPGNVISGEHRVSVLSTLFQLHPEVVKWYGRLLEETGVIADFDGEVLRLRPEALAA
jgi:hypothetical protein